ncbi:MAG: M56 family metallopeptidase [Fuerstiella sp.]
MNRITLLLLATSSLIAFPLLDSAIKGTLMLLMAACICVALRRDSAANRHFIWGIAICLLTVMPILSLILPGWNILPSWHQPPPITVTQTTSSFMLDDPGLQIVDLPKDDSAMSPETHTDFGNEDVSQLPIVATAPSFNQHSNSAQFPQVVSTATQPLTWPAWLMLIWLIGFAGFISRLCLAAWLLRRSANRCTEASTNQRLHKELLRAKKSMGVSRPVRLLMDQHRSIPLVWGLCSTRLQLPKESEDWTDEQLQSVLHHELAHVRRNDLFVLSITQSACAMHWFNPFAWFAARRLHIEREQACDDLVLASGIPASAYAQHLLNIATHLNSAAWTQSCGLAMARHSSLHNRLTAVLNEKQNRRSVTTLLLVLSIFTGSLVAIPLAMLQAADQISTNEGLDPPSFPEDKAATALVLAQATEADVNVAPLDQTPAQPPLQADDENTNEAASRSSTAQKLLPGLQQHLDWSVPINGLRAAVMIRAVKQKGESKTQGNIFLVIQNVSDQPIRLCDTAIHETKKVAANIEGRSLRLRRDGTTLMGIQRGVSSGTDVVLQANDTHIIDMLDSELLEQQGSNTAALLAAGIVKEPKQTLYAILNIVHAPEGAWTGKLTTPASRAAHSAVGPMPQDAEAQVLFRYCVDHARLSGEIPGGLMTLLHHMVNEFIRLNSGDTYGAPYAKRMQPLLANFQHQGDWKQTDVVAVFDKIAAVTTIPLNRTMRSIREHTLQQGSPLAPSLKNANWSKRLPSGLRMAWILEPQADEYHLGSALKSRVVIHNTGKEPVAFVTRSFHQPKHSAKSHDGSQLKIESTNWLTVGQPEPYRLHPGESCEVNAPGIGIGPRPKKKEDWANVRPGSWISASEGQEITFQPGEIMLTGDHNQKTDPQWWLKFIKERLDQDAPLPTDQQERELVLFRVVSDLFGNSPSPNEAAAFYPNQSPDALHNLAVRLSKRSWITSAAGPIQSGVTRFRVLPIDPDAATRVRVATNPGRYNLGDQLRLVVSRQLVGERIVNQASLVWYPPGKDSVAFNISLPRGYETWAAAWLPGSTALWIQQEGLLRKYNFANPADINEISFDTAVTTRITDEVRDALQKALTVSDAPVRQIQPPADAR